MGRLQPDDEDCRSNPLAPADSGNTSDDGSTLNPAFVRTDQLSAALQSVTVQKIKRVPICDLIVGMTKFLLNLERVASVFNDHLFVTCCHTLSFSKTILGSVSLCIEYLVLLFDVGFQVLSCVRSVEM